MNNFCLFQLNDPCLRQMFFVLQSSKYKILLKNALSNKRRQTVGEGRRELIPVNAKHLYAESKLRRINFSHISNTYLERSPSRRDSLKQKGIKFYEEG